METDSSDNGGTQYLSKHKVMDHDMVYFENTTVKYLQKIHFQPTVMHFA